VDATTASLFQQLLRDLAPRLPEGAFVLQDLMHALTSQPERLANIQHRYYQEHLALWSGVFAGDGAHEPAAEPASLDPRFASPEWRTLPWFDYLRRSYLINARWIGELLAAAQMPAPKKRRAAFVLRQYLDAIAPTNFAASNPEVIRLAAQTNGASLAQGLKLLSEDVSRGRIRMSDESAFEVGRNIAVTPGAVVYQNPIAELIQYTPRTEQVYSRPLLIVPPFINKYYVLDLRVENSFVRYALDQGIQVFLVSWRNVPRELGGSTWEDYIREGIYGPLNAVREITGCDQENVGCLRVGGHG
jgi:polyhydroxyalkanoate synthase